MSRQARTGQDVSFEANADLSALQFTAVKFVAGPAGGPDARVDAATSGRAHGILQSKPNAAGISATVRVTGFSKFKVDGTTPIAAGDPLKVTTGGVGIKATADHENVFAIACAGSSAASDIIEVMIRQFDFSA